MKNLSGARKMLCYLIIDYLKAVDDNNQERCSERTFIECLSLLLFIDLEENENNT